MTRYFAGIIPVFFLIFQRLPAQDISKLTVPTSPAFSILNYEPTAVMRPVNAKSIATDILNSFDKNGKLLMNLGLEVAPYWLKSHPDLKRNTYLHPDMGQTFMQSLSLSAATVKDSASGDNKLSAGFRFKLYNGEPVKQLEEAGNELKTKTTIVSVINGIKSGVGEEINTRQKAIDAVVSSLTKKKTPQSIIDNLKKEAEALAGNYTDTISGVKDFLDQLLNDRVEAYGELAKNVSDLLYQRTGFIIEFAGAGGFNTSKNNSVEKIGFWGNVSYSVSPDNFFTLTARYMFSNKDSALSNLDVGLGFLKKSANYNISVEAMFRHYRAEVRDRNINNLPITRIEKDITSRFAVQGSYSISKDVSVNISLGKDFNSPFINHSGFFSIMGINYSLFSKEPAKLN